MRELMNEETAAMKIESASAVKSAPVLNGSVKDTVIAPPDSTGDTSAREHTNGTIAADRESRLRNRMPAALFPESGRRNAEQSGNSTNRYIIVIGSMLIFNIKYYSEMRIKGNYCIFTILSRYF
jgi:hypothetical protein